MHPHAARLVLLILVALSTVTVRAGEPEVAPSLTSWHFAPFEGWSVREVAFSPRGDALTITGLGVYWTWNLRNDRLMPAGEPLTFSRSIFSKSGNVFVGITTPDSVEIQPVSVLIDGVTGRDRPWKGPIPGKPWREGNRPGRGGMMMIDVVDIAPSASAFAASFTEFAPRSTQFLPSMARRLTPGDPMPYTINRVAIGNPLTGSVTRVLESPLTDDPIRERDLQSAEELASRRIVSLAFSPDSKRIAAYVGTGWIIVWSVADGKVLRVFAAGDLGDIMRQEDHAFRWLGDSDSMITVPTKSPSLKPGEQVFPRYSVDAGEVGAFRMDFPQEAAPARRDGLPTPVRPTPLRFFGSAAGKIAFSPDGRFAAAPGRSVVEGDSSAGIRIVSLEDGSQRGVIPTTSGFLLAFSPDSAQFAMVHPSGTVFVLSTQDLLRMAEDRTPLPDIVEQPTRQKPPDPVRVPPGTRRP